MGYRPPPPPPYDKLPPSGDCYGGFATKEDRERTRHVEWIKTIRAFREIMMMELWYPKFYPSEDGQL